MSFPREPAAMIRRAHGGDAAALIALMAEHAVFERTTHPSAGCSALAAALSGAAPVLLVWVACRDVQLLGYLSATRDFSTWRCRSYLHMDCLYLQPQARGVGLGARLLQALCRHARDQGIDQVQWQTPHWNRPAERFYRRQGARVYSKQRFVLDLG